MTEFSEEGVRNSTSLHRTSHLSHWSAVCCVEKVALYDAKVTRWPPGDRVLCPKRDVSLTSAPSPCHLSPKRAGPAPAPSQNLATRAGRASDGGGGLSPWSSAARDPRPSGYVELMRHRAHRADEIEFSAELEDDAAQSGFGSPRPRAGRVGEVANLYGHTCSTIFRPPRCPTQQASPPARA